jgi:predicted transcriptional regulator
MTVFPGFEGLDPVAALAARRRELGLSQAEVAARMATTQSAVARLEAGAVDVKMSTLQRYAAALGGSLRWEVTDA